MEFSEKVKALRTKEKMSQEDLAEKLFVSRVTVSKWESGRGYPNISSLKLMAEVFGVTVDDLLSGEELVFLAETQRCETRKEWRAASCGVADVLSILCLLLPLYCNNYADCVEPVTLYNLVSVHWYVRACHYVIAVTAVVFGIAELVLQNWRNHLWLKGQFIISFMLSVGAVLFSISTRQMDVSLFTFTVLLAKVFFLIKTR